MTSTKLTFEQIIGFKEQYVTLLTNHYTGRIDQEVFIQLLSILYPPDKDDEFKQNLESLGISTHNIPRFVKRDYKSYALLIPFIVLVFWIFA